MTPRDLEQRRHLLLTMLALLACRYAPGCEPLVIIGVRRLLDGWLGIGRIAVGMTRQGYDLQLTRYGDQGWRATFFPAGLAHSITAAVGSAWARRPWEAEQRAAARAVVLATTYAAHPERFPGGLPQPPARPTEVWINPPATGSTDISPGRRSGPTLC